MTAAKLTTTLNATINIVFTVATNCPAPNSKTQAMTPTTMATAIAVRIASLSSTDRRMITGQFVSYDGSHTLAGFARVGLRGFN
jgi:hypothetical protein